MPTISRAIVVVTGIVVLILGIIMLIGLWAVIILSAGYSPYENTLAGASQEGVMLWTTTAASVGSIFGGLLFLMPLRMGRWLRAASYTTPDAEVIPKAYRSGGWGLIVVGIIAALANFLFAPMTLLDVVLLLVVIGAGVIGLLASVSRHDY